MTQIPMSKNSPFSLISTNKIIQMNDVWTSYDSKSYALEGVNLSIDRGTNYAIVGQSGSGKSTILSPSTPISKIFCPSLITATLFAYSNASAMS